MIGIFVANTNGFKKKFTLSFAIKLVSYWYLKEFKQRNPEFNWMGINDISTHTLIGYDTGKTGEKIIFESSKTQQLRHYYKSEYEFEFKDGVDVEIFWEVTKESIGNWYGVFQLYYFIRTAFWMIFFPKWFVKIWANLFHGGKHIFQWGNPFVWFQICTEQAYTYCDKEDKKYGYPSLREQLNRVNSNNVSPLLLLDMLLNAKETKL